MSPAPGQLSWDRGQGWTLPAMRPSLLLCELSHAVLLSLMCHRVLPRELWLHQVPAVLPKAVDLLHPTPLTPQQPLQDSL